MILLPKSQLRSSFFNRLKTQERAYNDIGIFYMPRLFTKLVKGNRILKNKLNSIYHDLVNSIEIELEHCTITFSDIEALVIENRRVFAILQGDNSPKYILKDIELKSDEKRELTIDHVVSSKDLISASQGKLIQLKKLTAELTQGKSLGKEQMRKEYDRILPDYSLTDLEILLEEIRWIAGFTTLRLMASDKNFSKGKRSIEIVTLPI